MKHLLVVAALVAPTVSMAEGFDGFYLGSALGHSWIHDEGTAYNKTTGIKNGWAQKTSPDGVSLGLLGGHNWKFDEIVVGVEADYDFRNSDDRQPQKQFGVTDPRYAAKTGMDATASLRARAGFALSSQTLIYGTAGIAVARAKRTFFQYPPLTPRQESHSSWQDGWTVGVGAEYLYSKNIAARVEYRVSDYGNKTVSSNMWNESYKQRLTDDSLRIGISYQF